jgi:hypothetical protein
MCFLQQQTMNATLVRIKAMTVVEKKKSKAINRRTTASFIQMKKLLA